jgi:predicted RNA methylase
MQQIIRLLNGAYDYYYDRTLGVKTSGIHPSGANSTFNDNVECCPTSYHVLKKIFNRLNLNDENGNILVDYGCGKGRVVCFAAQYNFDAIYGIEISKHWSDIAKQNVENLKVKNKRRIEIRNEDAVQFENDDATIYYFFNPFGEKTFKAVLDQIHKSILKNQRAIKIIYYNTVLKPILDQADWLEEIETLYYDSKGNQEVILYQNRIG